MSNNVFNVTVTDDGDFHYTMDCTLDVALQAITAMISVVAEKGGLDVHNLLFALDEYYSDTEAISANAEDVVVQQDAAESIHEEEM